MPITVKMNFDLKKLDPTRIIRIGLINTSEKIQAKAQENAPYETGTLKKSIGTRIWAYSATIWPRGVDYARRREFENNKNPSRKFYMKRSWEFGKNIAQKNLTKPQIL